jgi:hypothetical protein
MDDQTAHNMDNINTILPAAIGYFGVRCDREKSGPAYQKTEGFEVSAVMRRDAQSG